MTYSSATDCPAKELIALLDLETIGADLYRGYSPPTAGKQIYGGQAIAQSLVAATRTVPPDRPAHSLHGYFVLAGDPKTPIDFAVERVRDGKSFTTRRCNATQHGRTIFSMEASYQLREEGFTHASPMPEAPAPETLDSLDALAERFRAFLPEPAKKWLNKPSALDMRIVAPEKMLFPDSARQGQSIWFRIRGPLPENQALHNALLAYLSDMTLLNSALLIHGRTIFDSTIQAASLDHALWIHGPLRVDEWMLYVQESPMAANARALTRGQIFSREGKLVASVAQEGLIRRRTKL